jgi:PAS domain S-box-containing protein
MISNKIILQSTGSLAVALLSIIMMILQFLFYRKQPQNRWYGWSSFISFSSFLYAIGIFLEYNTPEGPANRFSGLLEYNAIIFLIHALYGFTFSYLGVNSKIYHPIAGLFHVIILVFLWTTDFIVSDHFVSWDFIGLSSPYVEPALGPLGPVFVGYTSVASLIAMGFWVRYKGTNPKQRMAYIIGLGIWILMGIHDGVASLGVPTLHYFMEYGFLGFSSVLLWGVFGSYLKAAADEKYRVITEFANDCILVIQDEKVVFGNPACGRLTGRPLTDSTPQEVPEIIRSEDWKTVLEKCQRLLDGGHVDSPFTIRIQREDGEERFVEIAYSMMQYRNRPAVLAVMRDMTERKREEEARQESERKIAALQKMESLGLLAGGVAHDLNNVLSGIVSYPDLLLSDLPEESKLRKPIKIMQTSAKRAAAIVEELLTIARGAAVHKEILPINDLINEYLQSAEYQKLLQYHPSVTIKTDLEPHLFSINASKIHIIKGIMNLVSNASEAIEGSGHVMIRTTNRYIDQTFPNYDEVCRGEYVVLAVSDDGPGIPPADLERIFEPFFTKKVMGRSGTGLGLALVWNVMKDHDGYIHVTSDETGTLFELYFPAVREDARKKRLPIPIEEIRGNGERVLIVDDVDSQREIASSMLEKLGYQTTCVSSGEEAIDYLQNHAADLVLLDMIMDPGISGCRTFERILETHPNQKAVIVSGYAETEEVKEAKRLGAGPYLKKPYTLEAIALAIKNELTAR